MADVLSLRDAGAEGPLVTDKSPFVLRSDSLFCPYCAAGLRARASFCAFHDAPPATQAEVPSMRPRGASNPGLQRPQQQMLPPHPPWQPLVPPPQHHQQCRQQQHHHQQQHRQQNVQQQQRQRLKPQPQKQRPNFNQRQHYEPEQEQEQEQEHPQNQQHQQLQQQQQDLRQRETQQQLLHHQQQQRQEQGQHQQHESIFQGHQQHHVQFPQTLPPQQFTYPEHVPHVEVSPQQSMNFQHQEIAFQLSGQHDQNTFHHTAPPHQQNSDLPYGQPMQSMLLHHQEFSPHWPLQCQELAHLSPLRHQEFDLEMTSQYQQSPLHQKRACRQPMGHQDGAFPNASQHHDFALHQTSPHQEYVFQQRPCHQHSCSSSGQLTQNTAIGHCTTDGTWGDQDPAAWTNALHGCYADMFGEGGGAHSIGHATWAAAQAHECHPDTFRMGGDLHSGAAWDCLVAVGHDMADDMSTDASTRTPPESDVERWETGIACFNCRSKGQGWLHENSFASDRRDGPRAVGYGLP